MARSGGFHHSPRVIWTALLVVASSHALAQRVLVETQPLTATREPVGVYLHSVEMSRAEALPWTERLAGVAPVGPMLLSRDGRFAVVATAAPWEEWAVYAAGEITPPDTVAFLSGCILAPFQVPEGGRVVLTPGWWQTDAEITYDGDGQPIVVAAMARIDEYGTYRGRLEVYRMVPDHEGVFAPNPTTYPLPGAPVATACFPGDARLAALCHSPSGKEVILQVVHADTGRVVVRGHPLNRGEANSVSTELAGLASSRDGAWLFALTKGPKPGAAAGEYAAAPTAWLRVLDGTSFQEVGEGLELQGAPYRHGESLHPCADGSCWVVTYTPGTDYAYACRVRIGADGLAKTAEVPLVGVSRPVLLQVAPDGTSVAVAIENRLEIWPQGSVSNISWEYSAPIGAISWSAEGLFIGEAGRVHWVDEAAGKPRVSVQLQTGHVAHLAPVPGEFLPQPDPDADGLTSEEEKERGADPLSPDSDKDGIPDGSDPEPLTPSPRLVVPPVVTLHGESAGRERRTVPVGEAPPETTTPASWTVEFDSRQMPWLEVQPRTGLLPGHFEVWVDPARFGEPTQLLSGFLTISAAGAQPDHAAGIAAGSPARIWVRVLPARSRAGGVVRRILWLVEGGPDFATVRDPEDPCRLKALADLLASPPHYFSHQTASRPFLGSLTPYTVVVLDARAAVRGAVTRPGLLDYVADGGALLFLGSSLNESAERSNGATPAVWLSPLGVRLDATVEVNGVFEAERDAPLLRYWDQFQIRRGCRIRLEDPTTLEPLVPAGADPKDCVFAAGRYGHGSVALLAAPTPLESPSLASPSNRHFAINLFRWLASARGDVIDRDGDGLPDSIEDRNLNGVVDPGETDPLHPDSDRDGLPDGKEDRNLNGIVDEDETSPLLADTDGDGIFDGADHRPLSPRQSHLSGSSFFRCFA